jgi:hypothetical protein
MWYARRNGWGKTKVGTLNVPTHSREKQPHRGHDDAILEVGRLRGRRYIGVRFQPRLAQCCIELVLSSLQPSIHRSENVHDREGFGASNGAVQLRRKSDLDRRAEVRMRCDLATRRRDTAIRNGAQRVTFKADPVAN